VLFPEQCSVARLRPLGYDAPAFASSLRFEAKVGGAEGIRTPDLCVANASLSQLSYSPIRESLVRKPFLSGTIQILTKWPFEGETVGFFDQGFRTLAVPPKG
jgi:hypothetical protein